LDQNLVALDSVIQGHLMFVILIPKQNIWKILSDFVRR